MVDISSTISTFDNELITVSSPPTEDSMFKLNDYAVYPGHGVAIVEDILEKMVLGATIRFLKLSFLFKDMTILVPLYNIVVIGIRSPCDEHVVDLVLTELTLGPEKTFESIDFTPSGWNRRFKDYQVKIQGGKILEIAKIYRDLMYVAQQKDLSFGERNILQTVEELISQEIQIVKTREREEVIELLRTPFKELVFHNRLFLQQETSLS